MSARAEPSPPAPTPAPSSTVERAPSRDCPGPLPRGVEDLFDIEVVRVTDEAGAPAGQAVLARRVLREPQLGNYAVLDRHGLAAWTHLDEVRPVGEGKSSSTFRVRLRLLEGYRQVLETDLSRNHLVAVGPLTEQPECARLLYFGHARAGGLASDGPEPLGVPAPAQGAVRYAVDLDGDGTADWAAVDRPGQWRKDGHWLRIQRHAEVLRFSDGDWQSVAQRSWEESQLVGP